MTIAGVAGDTTVAYPSRTETFARFLLEGVEMLEEVLARVKVTLHASYIYYSRSSSRVAGFLGSTQLSTRIPLFGSEVAGGLSKYILRGCQLTQ
jgi:hypothetical protein